MAIGVNSYGDPARVAAKVPRHANSDVEFTAATRPTLTQVEDEIDELSGTLNAILANVGFDIPITQADAKLALDGFVNKEVAAIVEGINGYGRFGPLQGKGVQPSKWSLIMDDVAKFIKTHAAGFERLGAVREYSQTAGLAFRETDERGNEIFPLFQRDAHGGHWTNWDSD